MTMTDKIPMPSDPQPSSPRGEERHEDENQSERTDVEQVPAILPKLDDAPPNGGYGWVCVACCFFINGKPSPIRYQSGVRLAPKGKRYGEQGQHHAIASRAFIWTGTGTIQANQFTDHEYFYAAHTWGINSSYGVFLSYYLNNDFFPNTSPLAYAFIGGLSISQAMLIAPIATRIIHVFGTRTCLHLGVFFETLSLIGASFCRKKYQIILAQGFCFGWGMGFLFVGSVGIVSQWFTTKRSLANSIAAAGSGLGGLMYSLVTQRVIEKNGLPWAFRVLGICVFTVNLTASNLIRDRNKQTSSRHKSFDLSILRKPEFLLLQGWSWFSMFGYTILLFSLPAYGRSIGLNANQSSILGAVLNLGQMVGRPFIGLSSDRWGRFNLATSLSLLCGILCITLWIPAEKVSSPMGILCFFAIIGGATAGVYWATIAPVAAEVLGLQDLPAGLSWTWLLIVPPTTVAEAIALELRRKNTTHWIYLPPQIFTAVMYVAGAMFLWVARGWKVGEREGQKNMIRAREQRRQQQQRVLLDEKQTLSEEGASRILGAHGGVDADDIDEEELKRHMRREIWKPKNLVRNMLARTIV